MKMRLPLAILLTTQLLGGRSGTAADAYADPLAH
jgi:hypothetical protein